MRRLRGRDECAAKRARDGAHLQSSLTEVQRRRIFRASVAVFVVVAFAAVCVAAVLEKTTIEAFNHYVQVAEEQSNATLRPNGPFLWVDSQPDSQRASYYQQLRSGQFVIRHLHTRDDGKSISIPDGMVHNWLGVVFVRGATIQTAEAVFQDYRDYSRIYGPQVRQSRVLSRTDDNYRLYLQLYKDSPREVAYNADFDVKRISLGPMRVASSSISTRIAQLKDPSKINSPELPVGNDSGYIWRLNDYWRYEQKDGGVYMQVETISLSRDVPMLLSWIVKPIIHHVARETIAGLLGASRDALEHPNKYAPGALGSSAAASDGPPAGDARGNPAPKSHK